MTNTTNDAAAGGPRRRCRCQAVSYHNRDRGGQFFNSNLLCISHNEILSRRFQCHPIKFVHSNCRLSGAGQAKHELIEFPNEFAYLTFDASQATQLKNLTHPPREDWVVGPDDFQTVTKYFGCDGDHNSGSGVRASAKTNLDFIQRFEGYRCGGRSASRMQRFRGKKNEKRCKKLCEKRNGCVAYEYHFRRIRQRGRNIRMRTCKTFNDPIYPNRGRRNRYSTCAIARESCVEAPGA